MNPGNGSRIGREGMTDDNHRNKKGAGTKVRPVL